ncbi:4161_t:CDS:1, partial [Cetraspora pellucida]
ETKVKPSLFLSWIFVVKSKLLLYIAVRGSNNNLNLGIKLLPLVITDSTAWLLLTKFRLYVSTLTSLDYKDSKLSFISVFGTVE